MKVEQPPPYMRQPNIPGLEFILERGTASDKLFWTARIMPSNKDGYLTIYEDGYIFSNGKRTNMPGATNEEKYEAALNYVETLFALGEESVLWEN